MVVTVLLIVFTFSQFDTVLTQVFPNSHDNSFGITMDKIHTLWTMPTSYETLIPNSTQPLSMLFTAFGENNGIISNISTQYLIIYDLCNDIGAVRVITSTLENKPIVVYGYASNNYYTVATDVRSSIDLSEYVDISKSSNNNIYGIYDMSIPSNTDSFFVVLYNEDHSKYISHHVNVTSCDGHDTSTIQNYDTFILPYPPYFTDVSIKSFTKSISPEIVEPEIVEPEIVEPEIVEPEIVEPEIVEPEIVEPEIVEPEIVEPEIVEPEIVEPEIVEPEIVEPEIVEPEIVEPEIVEPEIVEPEIVEPEIVEPEIVEPEIVEPEIVEPEIVEPEIVEPEIVEPEIVEPEIVEPEIVEPEIVEPEIVEPEQIKNKIVL